MNLTNLEKNIILVSLDHMEEHLLIVYEAGDITEDQYYKRIAALITAKYKI